MALEVVKGLEDLARVQNGALNIEFKKALGQVMDDLNLDTGRPNLKAKRKVVVEVCIEPVVDGKSAPGRITVDYSVQCKLPAQRIGEYSAMVVGVGGYGVNELSPKDVRQATLDLKGRDDAEEAALMSGEGLRVVPKDDEKGGGQ